MFLVKSADSIRQNVRTEPSSAHAHQHRLYSLADQHQFLQTMHTYNCKKRFLNSQQTNHRLGVSCNIPQGRLRLCEQCPRYIDQKAEALLLKLLVFREAFSIPSNFRTVQRVRHGAYMHPALQYYIWLDALDLDSAHFAIHHINISTAYVQCICIYVTMWKVLVAICL